MPGVLRSLTGRGVWTGVVGLALAAPAAGQEKQAGHQLDGLDVQLRPVHGLEGG